MYRQKGNNMKTKERCKQINIRMDDALFVELEKIRETLGVNWSFQVRDFLQDKVAELKPQAQAKMKR